MDIYTPVPLGSYTAMCQKPGGKTTEQPKRIAVCRKQGPDTGPIPPAPARYPVQDSCYRGPKHFPGQGYPPLCMGKDHDSS